MGKKLVLGGLGAVLVAMLWVKVRAAQGMSPARALVAPASLSLMRGEAGAFDGAAVAGSAGNALPAAPPKGLSGGSGRGERGQAPVPRGFPKKIVRNANVQFEVKDFEHARKLALAVAAQHGAEIAQDDGQEHGGWKGGTIGLRVAPERLDALLKALEPVGRALHRSVSRQDMSEEYVDLQSRVNHLRRVENRLHEMMAFKTSKLEHVLQIEQEMRRVGEEIERVLGRMKYIDALAAESLVTIGIREPAREPSQAAGAGNRAWNSLTRSFNTFATTGLLLLDLTGFLLAIGLWAAPFAGLGWLAYRRMDSR